MQYIIKAYCRTGMLWESRHKCSLVQADDFLLACYRHIEMPPVMTGMIECPADYAWSSYWANVFGESHPHIASHPLYLAPGTRAQPREKNYRELFASEINEELVHDISCAAGSSMPIGNARFIAQIEKATGNTIGHSKTGPP